MIQHQRKEETGMKKVIKVEGMMCEHCEATVVKALKKIDGVTEASADHVKGEAVVELSKEVDNELLKEAIEDRDYKVLGFEE